MIEPKPSKLFKLKKWLTLNEAARHLSGICGEEVTVADILRLALDKHLRLSVNFVNHTSARPGTVVQTNLHEILGSLNAGEIDKSFQFEKT